MSLPKVLIADPISHRGIDELGTGGALEVIVKTGLKEAELIELIPDFSAVVVRSQTKISASILQAATRLRVVGRAGVGVDNVDVEAATRRGVIVMHTPGGNTVSTAEHAFSLLVSVARKIPQAHANLQAGRWDRKQFEGTELYGKTLGIIGMGRIGSELSRRAIAFGNARAGLRSVSFCGARASAAGRAIRRDRRPPAALRFPHLAHGGHAPLAERHSPHEKQTRRSFINCARGGLIDEAALLESLGNGQVAGAALDVFETEPLPNDSPLRGIPNLILTPHLGASNAEAQESVGIEIAQAIRAALLEGTIRNAVNMPNLDAKTLAIVGPHLRFGESSASFCRKCLHAASRVCTSTTAAR